MTAAGRAAIAVAKARSVPGTFLDDVERLELPEDLVRALDAERGARERFDRFPDSSKRGNPRVDQVGEATGKRGRSARAGKPPTRPARNLKANFPAGRDAGPPL